MNHNSTDNRLRSFAFSAQCAVFSHPKPQAGDVAAWSKYPAIIEPQAPLYPSPPLFVESVAQASLPTFRFAYAIWANNHYQQEMMECGITELTSKAIELQVFGYVDDDVHVPLVPIVEVIHAGRVVV